MTASADQTRTAVVLARGLGTRMRADSPIGSGLTSEQAAAAACGYKALMPIGEHLLIDYSLSALADAGITRAVLVVGPEHEDFRSHIDSLELKRLTIDLAVQTDPLGTADAVLSAEPVVGQDPFIMVNGDNHYPRQALCDLARHRGNALAGFDRAKLVTGSNIPEDRIAAFALVRAHDGLLEEIVEKPSPQVVQAAGDHALVSMNAFSFTSEIFAACRQIGPSPRGELEIVDAVRALPGPVSVLPATGAVLDLSRREDVSEVEARLAGVEVSL